MIRDFINKLGHKCFELFINLYFFRTKNKSATAFLREPIVLGTTVDINIYDVWRAASFRLKLYFLTTFRIPITYDIVNHLAEQKFRIMFRYDSSPFGSMLYALAQTFESKEIDHQKLTERDYENIQSIREVDEIFDDLETTCPSCVANHLKIDETRFEILKLISEAFPTFPIHNADRYIKLNLKIAFANIRNSDLSEKVKHELISYIYESTFLQQKIFESTRNLLIHCFTIQTRKRKEMYSMMGADLNGILNAELSITYLKALSEKNLNFLCVVLSRGKDFSGKSVSFDSKIIYLLENFPKWKAEINYLKLQHDELDFIDTVRTGFLHKKGNAKLQPHSYVNKFDLADTPLFELQKKILKIRSDLAVSYICALNLITKECFPEEIMPSIIIQPDGTYL